MLLPPASPPSRLHAQLYYTSSSRGNPGRRSSAVSEEDTQRIPIATTLSLIVFYSPLPPLPPPNSQAYPSLSLVETLAVGFPRVPKR